MNTSIENYYKLISDGSFNDADPEEFIKEFRETQSNTSIAIRIQESAIQYSDEGFMNLEAENEAIKKIITEYATILLNDQPLSHQKMISIMKSYRKTKNQRIDSLPDWEGDTMYALIPDNSKLLVNIEQFDESSIEFTVKINGTSYAAHRLWWD